MMTFGAIGFLQPWMLLGLAALPAIWWLLRLTPPTPQQVVFPPTRLLKDLKSTEETPAHSPWWLTALRMLLAALIVLALARPVLNPDRESFAGTGPLLLVVDNGWASAAHWPERREVIDAAIEAVPAEVLGALKLAALRIESHHRRQLPKDDIYEDDMGVGLGSRWTAIEAVGLYVPGGTASYPSSVLMNAVPAKVAGVDRIVIAVPATGGAVNPAVLAAARLVGVTEIYRVGGAQAIAALAYGTETIALGLAVVFTLALAILLAEFVAQPIRRLTTQTAAIAHGDYSRPVDITGSGEMVALSEAVGEMADRLISPAGLIFKGSGFYITDYGKDGKKQQAAPESKTSAPGEKTAAPAESKTSDSKPAAESKPAAPAKNKE